MIQQAGYSQADQISRYRDTGTLIVGVIALFLAAALILEFAFDMEPCPLCLTQRLFFMLAGVVALIGTCALTPNRQWPIATGIAALIGIGFALRQLYLYLLPPDQIPACSAPISRMIEFAPFMELFAAMTMGTGNCAEASFPFLGFDLPGYLIPLGSMAGFAVVLVLVVRQWRSAKLLLRFK